MPAAKSVGHRDIHLGAGRGHLPLPPTARGPRAVVLAGLARRSTPPRSHGSGAGRDRAAGSAGPTARRRTAGMVNAAPLPHGGAAKPRSSRDAVWCCLRCRGSAVPGRHSPLRTAAVRGADPGVIVRGSTGPPGFGCRAAAVDGPCVC